MAIIKVGLKRAEKSQGQNPTGQKVYLVGSDTKISDNVDDILDASYLGGDAVPGYDQLWSLDFTNNLRVESKRAMAWDEEEGTQEGYWWIVTVNYAVPDITSNQNAEDPRDRDWLWSKTTEKSDRVLVNSFFDTSGYVYPNSNPDGSKMINLTPGDAITNTAGEPPEGGVLAPISNTIITLSKFIDNATDLGLSDFGELDSYVDSINDTNVVLLDELYFPWELLMDDISYEPVNENGFDVIKVVFRIKVDTYKRHVFTFPSAGYNEKAPSGKKGIVRIKDSDRMEVVNPQLLDADGSAIPFPDSTPYIKIPYLVSVGINQLKDWSAISLPTAIP